MCPSQIDAIGGFECCVEHVAMTLKRQRFIRAPFFCQQLGFIPLLSIMKGRPWLIANMISNEQIEGDGAYGTALCMLVAKSEAIL